MRFFEPRHYQPAINRLFRKVAREVGRQLPFARIEHIGASSTSGAVSKGDLDVFVGVARCRFRQSIPLLEEIGYSVKPDTLRTESLCMLETRKYARDVALQLVENGSRFETFLQFRDLLQADATLLSEYNAMKRACEGMDEDSYRRTKADFIEGLLQVRDASSGEGAGSG